LQDPRANLTVHLHSQASKIIFDKNKRAIGVEVLSGGQKHIFTARKEAILSAGVFHSPQILQLSGKSQYS
jgi:choline dehydrogenase